MDKGKLKTFVSKHKTEIVLGATIVLGGILIAVNKKPNKIKDIVLPTDFSAGEITDIWEEDGVINAIVCKLTTKELGNLGNEFVKHGLALNEAEAEVVVSFKKEL